LIRSRFVVPVAAWLVCGFAVSAMAGTLTTDRPDVRSNAVLVLDTDGSTVLFARNETTPRPIASLTKIMTALVVVEANQSLVEEIAIVREDRDGTLGSGSRVPVGAKLTRGDLLRLALMASDNRAAHALARTYPGGKQMAIRAMNAKAKALGMTTAKFDEPSGLSPRNIASATDISKLMAAAANHPTIREYSVNSNHSVILAKRAVEFRNTNYLVTKPDWNIELQKTGYTSEAGQCLAMKTVIQGRSLIIVLLDSFGKHTRTADARRIRKWLEAKAQQVATR
jgi:serine-type D-Ala-D-Ala endopeptidase (penicillin-binding protein 7)